MGSRERSPKVRQDSKDDKVTGGYPQIELPYYRGFLERVPLTYLKLHELAAGALDSRDMHSDGYWKIESRSETVAYVALRRGEPYRIIGMDFTQFDSFLSWLQKQAASTEMFLTCRFLPDNSLKYAVRCLEEQPVLSKLRSTSGQISELLDTLSTRGESGLLRLEEDNNRTILIPVLGGEPLMAILPGTTLDSSGASDYIQKSISENCKGYFYSGETPELSPIGLAEIPLLLRGFNNWFARMSGIWPDSFGVSVKLFGKLREKKPFVQDLILKPDGLSLRGPFSQPGKLPAVIVVLVKAIAKKYDDPQRAIKLFREVNMAARHALLNLGLGKIMGKSDKD